MKKATTAELIDKAARHIAEKVVSENDLTVNEKIKGFHSLIDYLKLTSKAVENSTEMESIDDIRARIEAVGNGKDEPAA